MRPTLRSSARLLPLAVLLAVIGCSGGDKSSPTQPPGQQGTLTLSTTTPAVLIAVGGTGVANLAIARGGGFTGTVSLSVSGLPTGITGTFAPASLDASSTTSVLALTAAASVAAGTSTLTVTASGTGVTSQTATIVLTITQPTIALTATPTTTSITAGQVGSVTVAISRSTGFTGAVTLTLDSPPAGITGSFTPATTTAISSSLTLTVVASVAAGSYPLTIKGSAAGVQDKTAQVTVTVVASGPIGFSITVDPAEFELAAGRGWAAYGVANVQRLNGFTGPVSVTVQGLSFPAVVAPTPAVIAPSENATNLFALAIDNAVPGVYSGTVKVTAAGFADQTVPVRFRVSLPSTGSITWNFCRADRVPRYFAVRDGSGAWRHIVPNGPAAATAASPASYSFDVTQSTASVALVFSGEKTSARPIIAGPPWNVVYMTRQEIVDLAAEECITNRDTNTRQASGAVGGYQSFDAIIASAGRFGQASVGSTGPVSTTLSMRNLPPGPFDLLLSRTNFVASSQDLAVRSIVLRRGIDPAPSGTVPAVDFATEGVAPASASLTFANTNAEAFSNTMSFRTTDGLNAWLAVAAAYAPTVRTWYGVPTSKLIAGDLHQVTASTSSVTARRQIIHFSRDVAARTLTFGAPLSLPIVTSILSTPWIVDASGTLGPDYTSRVSVYYRETIADPRTMTLVATRGFLGGQTQYAVRVPDLAGTTAFTSAWYFRRQAPVKWIVTGGQGSTGDLLSDGLCAISGLYCPVKAVDGATYLSAQATGTMTIP